jgi:hypothetical protein
MDAFMSRLRDFLDEFEEQMLKLFGEKIISTGNKSRRRQSKFG